MSLLQAMISAEGVKWCLIYMPSLTQSRVKEDISVDLVHVYLQVYIHVNATVPNEKLLKEYTIFLLFCEQLQWLLSFLLLLGAQVSPLNLLFGASCA